MNNNSTAIFTLGLKRAAAIFICTSFTFAQAQAQDAPADGNSQPNILFILSDDQGLDSSAQYPYSSDVPVTPVLDQIASAGVVFDNAWATPMCSTTRAAFLTGKHGVNSGLVTVPGTLDPSNEIVYEFLSAHPETANYAGAYIGKWHMGTAEINGEYPPVGHGISYFAGTFGNINTRQNAHYYDWPLIIDEPGVDTYEGRTDEYSTSKLTRLAEDWIEKQDTPWLLTLAYHAPHAPFQWPPDHMHSRGEHGEECGPRDCYLAMIEAMDFEIGNLIDKLSELGDLENTLIIMVGDNGSPQEQSDSVVFESTGAKGSLYEGGIGVPFVVSGAGVTRRGERDQRMVNITDLYATIADVAGISLAGSINDSYSFAEYLNSAEGSFGRPYNYSEYAGNNVSGWVVRNDSHMLMHNDLADGAEILYRLNGMNFELVDDTQGNEALINELRQFGMQVRGEL